MLCWSQFHPSPTYGVAWLLSVCVKYCLQTILYVHIQVILSFIKTCVICMCLMTYTWFVCLLGKKICWHFIGITLRRQSVELPMLNSCWLLLRHFKAADRMFSTCNRDICCHTIWGPDMFHCDWLDSLVPSVSRIGSWYIPAAMFQHAFAVYYSSRTTWRIKLYSHLCLYNSGWSHSFNFKVQSAIS